MKLRHSDLLSSLLYLGLAGYLGWNALGCFVDSGLPRDRDDPPPSPGTNCNDCDGLGFFHLRLGTLQVDPPNPEPGEEFTITWSNSYSWADCDGAVPLGSGVFEERITLERLDDLVVLSERTAMQNAPSILMGESNQRSLTISQFNDIGGFPPGSLPQEGQYRLTVTLDPDEPHVLRCREGELFTPEVLDAVKTKTIEFNVGNPF